MRKFSVLDIEKEYDLELEKVVSEIKNSGAKKILLQFPDGLKQYAVTVLDYLKDKVNVNEKEIDFFIWFGSCFGACDTPVLPKGFDEEIDLVVQFGHNELMPSY